MHPSGYSAVGKSESYYDHTQSASSNFTSLVPSSFLSPTPSYTDSMCYQSQPPVNIYNSNFNPNYHHHHYYYPLNGSQESTSNWMRRYDYDNQYFIANTPPTPTECCDFEVPQQPPSATPSPRPSTMKILNDLDKIFFDDQVVNKCKEQINSEVCEGYGNSFWPQSQSDSESFCGKAAKKTKPKEKPKRANVKQIVKSVKQNDDLGLYLRIAFKDLIRKLSFNK